MGEGPATTPVPRPRGPGRPPTKRPWAWPSNLLPLFVNAFHFFFRRSGGILGTQVAFDYAEKHLGDDTSVENLHGLRCRVSRGPEIPSPFQRILQLLVLGRRAAIRVPREPVDQVRNRVLVDGKVAGPALLEDCSGIVDQVDQE